MELKKMKTWTESDIGKLIEWYKDYTYKSIAEELDRNEKSVKNKIYQLRMKGVIE